METLELKTIETAPEEAKETLKTVQRKFGFIPNLMAAFANSPLFLKTYMQLSADFERSTLNATERELVLLAASVANNCLYCIAGYATALRKMKVSSEIIDGVKFNTPLAEKKLDALVNFTKELVNSKGHPSGVARNNFYEAGYTDENIMEVLIGVALKTMANYMDHLFPIEIDFEYDQEAAYTIDETHE